jgi:cytosine/adenosine deaminase-related metal-dependent hydrolase
MNEVGLRGVLSYAVTDRYGAVGREEGLEETVSFARKAKGRFRGRVGAHAAFTLSKEGLEGVAEAVKATGAGLHLMLAEDPADERLSSEKQGGPPVARLAELGLLTPQTLVAHVLHLGWPELSQVISTGAWLAHCPRENMRQMRGFAPSGKFGARAALGTASFPADLLAEAQLAQLRSREAEQPIDILRYLANGQRLASEAFGLPMGPLREGAAADLVVMDYRPVTPLNEETLAGHVVEALGSRFVESVMVDGVWRLWARRPLSAGLDTVTESARQATTALWAKMAESK